ncbi:hypothetical protein H4582DRAFT_1821744 [Lactarius indigo]|nr:hypothetical protein H4582DRAFT_1821744 [Lactarius indigo]
MNVRPSYRKSLGSCPPTTFAHLDTTTVLSRLTAELAIYPTVDPLNSKSRTLGPRIVSVSDSPPATTFTHLDATTAVVFDSWARYLPSILSTPNYECSALVS